MATGWNFHELYLWHETGNAAGLFPPGLTIEPGQHFENAETKRRFRNLMEVSGLLDRLTPISSVEIDAEDLALVHDRAYVERIRAMSAERGGDASPLTPFGAGSYEIACKAVGGTTAVMDAVLKGEIANGYALVRPPGHHAEPEVGMGFCLFANIPLAIAKLKPVHGFSRVATVDWDVHHGNGTQAVFYDDPSVLTISLHQDRLYPHASGLREERGTGAGEGYNINVPLPAGSGHGAYLAAFERVVLPALRRYRPDLIVVPSGFDAAAVDPLGRMMLHSGTYREMTRLLMEAADELCGGRLAMSHEGGYSSSYVPYCGLAVMEQLSGWRSAVDDPFLPVFQAYEGQTLRPHQEAEIMKAADLVEALR
ncbi:MULTISPECIES: class II histone deacetylase [unclassified Aureimonas]|uniref:class II histone deacetylase n=1 Tax=unclassified Aureimonas TaxID=2615206 RepID=UPI0006FE5339|nr:MULTISPECIES: class II histone deacetylase [unclassified Aureimonas]KQT63970.1 acetoin utilization protein [Aureimonas sp. Leaf427]KQT81163.1 acetoin utilization protein [Aureimonas sp. Leaf460]